MSKENNKTNTITSNAFLEQVLPQIKLNQQSFPLNNFDTLPTDAASEEVPAREKR